MQQISSPPTAEDAVIESLKPAFLQDLHLPSWIELTQK